MKQLANATDQFKSSEPQIDVKVNKSNDENDEWKVVKLNTNPNGVNEANKNISNGNPRKMKRNPSIDLSEVKV